GLNHMLLVLQFGADGHYDLANVDLG
ncbi:hypothetical protein DBR06_SOUSAS28510003, partial [Sousa chinensis]